jgi:hypothetical protein
MDKDKVLQQCYADVQQIVRIFAEHNLPLRGAMSFGRVAWDVERLVGQPLLSAYSWEGKVPAPVVLIPQRDCMPSPDAEIPDVSLKDFRVVVLKDGTPVLAHVLLPRPLDEFVKLVDKKVQHHLVWGPSNAARSWYELSNFIRQYAS